MMFIIIWLCLTITTVLGAESTTVPAVAVTVQTTVQTTIAAVTTPRTPMVIYNKIPIPNINDTHNMGCEKPRDSATYKSCVTGGEKFPAFYVTCQCVQCYINMALTCHSDGNWYSNTGINVCDLNKHKKCGHCQMKDIPAAVKCVRTKNGFVGDGMTCICKNNCIAVLLKCDQNKKWTSDYLKICDSQVIHQIYKPNSTMSIEIKNGYNFYKCDKGFKLSGKNVTICKNGVLSHQEPMCLPEDISNVNITLETDSEQNNKTTTINQDSFSTLEITMIILFSIAFIFSIIIIIIWYIKTHNMLCFKSSGDYVDPIDIDNFNVIDPLSYRLSSYVEVLPDSNLDNPGSSNRDDSVYKYDYVYSHLKKDRFKKSTDSPAGISNTSFQEPEYANDI